MRRLTRLLRYFEQATLPTNSDAHWDATKDFLIELAKNWKTRRHEHYGLRALPVSPRESLGDTCEPSYEWQDGRNTGKQLEGTCAVNFVPENSDYYDPETAVKSFFSKMRKEYGEHLMVIAGDEGKTGRDPHEVVIKDARRVF